MTGWGPSPTAPTCSGVSPPSAPPSTPFAIAGLCIALIALIINSSSGRALTAIRDDEIAAEAMGINLFRHKQMAFVISSFFAGVGGALLAMYQTTVQASAFTAAMTYELLLIVVIGGMGSLSGSVIASFLFVASSEWWLRFLDNEQVLFGVQLPFMRPGFRMVIFSIIIMVMVLFYRRGIMGDKELSFSRMLGIGRKGRAPWLRRCSGCRTSPCSLAAWWRWTASPCTSTGARSWPSSAPTAPEDHRSTASPAYTAHQRAGVLQGPAHRGQLPKRAPEAAYLGRTRTNTPSRWRIPRPHHEDGPGPHLPEHPPLPHPDGV